MGQGHAEVTAAVGAARRAQDGSLQGGVYQDDW